MTDATEDQLKRLRDRLKANCEAEHGPGSFDSFTSRGRIMMAKRDDELTEAEREFIRSPLPNKRQS
jgi:hypothetical protein